MIILAVVIGSIAFADTKVYTGYVNYTDNYTRSDDYTKFNSTFYKDGFYARTTFDYDYVTSDTYIVLGNNYWNVTSKNKIKFDGFFIGTDEEIGRNVTYVDVTVGYEANKDVKDWLNIGFSGAFGYVPLNIVGSFDERNLTVAKLQVNVKLWNIVTFYAGMESLQQIGLPTFKVYSVKNTIGVKAEYFWNNFGVYGLVDYYCKHPEVFGNEPVSFCNSVKMNASVGVVLKI